MDARTRHELKQNELVEVLSRLRHLNDPRIRLGLVAIGIVVVVVLAWYAFKINRKSAQEQSWRSLQDLAASAETADSASLEQAQTGLRDLIAKGGDAVVVGYARLQLAALRIDDALAKTDQRPAGFEEAAKLLTEIRSTPETPPALYAAASFALAGACESMRQFDKARELYTELSNDAKFEGMVYKSMAAERLANLEDVKAAVAFTPGGPPATVEPPSEPGAAPSISGLPPGATMRPSGPPPGMDPEALKRMTTQQPGATPPPAPPGAAPAPPAAPAGQGQSPPPTAPPPAAPPPATPPPAQPPPAPGTPQSP